MKIDRPKPEKFKVCTVPVAIKADNGDRIITGYASTPDLDSYDEIVSPSAFEEKLLKFLEFPVLLVNHLWYDDPIGGFTEVKVQDGGLYVEAFVSKTQHGDDIWTLIQDGVLKAFSIGYRPIAEEHDEETGITTITKLELIEISIVNVPANRQALFEAAKSKGLKSFDRYETIKTKNERGGDMTPEEIKAAAEQAVKAELEKKTIDITASAAEAIEKSITPKFKDLEGEFKSFLMEAREAAKNCVTTADHKQLIDKLKAVEDAQQIIHNRQKAILAGQTREISLPENGIEFSGEDHRYGKAYGAALTLPDSMLGGSKDAIHEWREAHDHVAFLHAMMGKRPSYQGPHSLKAYKRYRELTEAVFAKAMSATGTGYGDEWVPTELSSQLTDLVEQKAIVASQFPVIPMPTNPFEMPYKSGHITVYNYDEPTVDFATEISRSTPTTGKNTLTAKGVAAATVISKDATEDSLIAMIPIIRDDMALTMARQWDNAYINGDTTATHRDTGFSAVSGDVRKMYDGLRHQANADSKEYNCKTVLGPNSADWEAADIMMTLKQMGACGSPERKNDLFIVMSLDNFWEAWLWEEVKTIDKFGPAATVITGDLTRIFGIPIITSEFIRTDYTSDGIYTGSNSAGSVFLMVYRPGWVSGSRRAITIESDPNIVTQQTVIVATARRAFRQLRAVDTEYNCVAGINIPVL